MKPWAYLADGGGALSAEGESSVQVMVAGSKACRSSSDSADGERRRVDAVTLTMVTASVGGCWREHAGISDGIQARFASVDARGAGDEAHAARLGRAPAARRVHVAAPACVDRVQRSILRMAEDDPRVDSERCA